MRNSKIYAWNWTLVWVLGLTLAVVISMWLSDGHLIYTLDDPYIHLALAEGISKGGYGVNAGEFSSPSSSILYPLLLTITELLGLGPIGPLVVNAAASGLSVWLLLEFFWRYAIPETTPCRAVFPNIAAPLLILSINAFALPMTGMEHSLHVLAVLATFRGLVAIAEGEPMPIWLAPAIIGMPLIRFEGMALAAAVLLALVLLGKWRSACAIGAVVIACYATFGFVMHKLGLPVLPSSVMSKSSIAASVAADSSVMTGMMALARNFWFSLLNRWGLIFGLAVCALIIAIQDREGRTRPVTSPGFIVGGTMALALGAHLIAGRYGWFYRYEVYAVAILIIGGIYVLRGSFRHLTENRFVITKLGVIGALAIIFLPYFYATLSTPWASRGVYEQQFQMHRFATEFFPRRVAVNDLGWVSYKNDNYVLDLGGLGSERVRQLQAEGKLNAKTMARLIEEADVDLVMIYPHWFGQAVPEIWCPMAVLKRENVTAARDSVHFYATNRTAVADMRAALDRFAPTLPNHVVLERYSCSIPKDAG